MGAIDGTHELVRGGGHPCATQARAASRGAVIPGLQNISVTQQRHAQILHRCCERAAHHAYMQQRFASRMHTRQSGGSPGAHTRCLPPAPNRVLTFFSGGVDFACLSGKVWPSMRPLRPWSLLLVFLPRGLPRRKLGRCVPCPHSLCRSRERHRPQQARQHWPNTGPTASDKI
jgi:hypothetical protein